jgi:hypothetical protein
LILDFSSDAGYTPPPPSKPRPSSAERPRLKDLDTRTLEPIEVEDEDDMFQLPSPTPRKPREKGKPSDFLLDEDENEIIARTPSLPIQRPEGGLARTPLERPEGGHAFVVEGYSQEFVIYSDPKSKSPEPGQEITPKAATQDSLNEPPRSVSPSPVRKRRSSDAGLDSEGELTAVERTPPKKKKTRTAAAAVKKATRAATKEQKEMEVTTVTTETLRSLLPSRKRNSKKPQDIFEFTTSTEEEQGEDVDELAPRRKPRKAAAPAKKTPVKNKGKSKETTTAKGKAAETTASKRPASTKKTPSKTYATKRKADNTAPEKAADGDDERSSGLSEPPSSDTTCTGSEHGHWLDDINVRKKMKEVRKKFQEVDQWPLEFEDVSASQADELDTR